MQLERRNLKTELRAISDGGKKTIEGYAAKFGVLSHDLGGFREILLPGCFDLENSPKIVCNLEHDNRAMLGTTKSGTLTVTVDEIGLFFRCVVPDTVDGQKATALVERQDLDECSFCFYLADDGSDENWTTDGDGPVREVKHCLVADVSIVVDGAYPNTEVALRGLEKFKRSLTETDYELDFWRWKIRTAEFLHSLD